MKKHIGPPLNSLGQKPSLLHPTLPAYLCSLDSAPKLILIGSAMIIRSFVCHSEAIIVRFLRKDVVDILIKLEMIEYYVKNNLQLWCTNIHIQRVRRAQHKRCKR